MGKTGRRKQVRERMQLRVLGQERTMKRHHQRQQQWQEWQWRCQLRWTPMLFMETRLFLNRVIDNQTECNHRNHQTVAWYLCSLNTSVRMLTLRTRGSQPVIRSTQSDSSMRSGHELCASQSTQLLILFTEPHWSMTLGHEHRASKSTPLLILFTEPHWSIRKSLVRKQSACPRCKETEVRKQTMASNVHAGRPTSVTFLVTMGALRWEPRLIWKACCAMPRRFSCRLYQLPLPSSRAWTLRVPLPLPSSLT